MATPTFFPFTPNWANSVDVQVSYRTDIITSRSGREQRRALRTKPRRQLSYTTTVDGAERQKFIRTISRHQGQPMLIGDPTRSIKLVDKSPAGSGIIHVNDAPEWLTEGSQILLVDAAAVVTVTDIGDRIVTYTPAADILLPADSIVRPVLRGIIGGQIGAGHPVSRVAQANISFDVDPGFEPATVGAPGIYIHGGREVFALRPNWSEAVDQALEWPVEQVDYGHGRLRTFQPVDTGWLTQSATYLGVGAAETTAIETLFHRMRGRRGEFLMPTGTDDLTMVGQATTGASTLTVAGTATFNEYEDDDRYRAIMVRLNDGRTLMRSISSMSVVDGNTVLQLNANWFFGFDAPQVGVISWLHVVRFASDDLNFEW